MKSRYTARNEGTVECRLNSNVIIIVEGNILPSEIKIWDGTTSIKVTPYIEPVMQCYSCFKYGHIKVQCRGTKICGKCGENFHGVCERKENCSNCKGEHRATFKGCKEYEYNKRLKTVMATHKVDIFEAKKMCDMETTTSNTAWSRVDSSAASDAYRRNEKYNLINVSNWNEDQKKSRK